MSIKRNKRKKRKSASSILPFKCIPNIPDEIINAIDTNRLMLFVGAGLSRIIGYCSWKELGEKLATIATKKHVLSLSEKEILLSNQFKPMEVITIAAQRLDSIKPHFGLNCIVKELSEGNKIQTKIDKNLASKIGSYLAKYNSPIVTTNADISLEKTKAMEKRVILNSLLDYNNDFNDTSIIHLHGSIKEPKGMVFTSEQYASLYSVDTKVGEKLRELFNTEWTILFIGYGVAEFELLRYFLKYKNDKTRHLFVLEGYLAKDNIKYNFDKEYFGSLGITLLPYSREKKNYFGLIDVLKKWNKDVENRTYSSSLSQKGIITNIVSKKPSDVNVLKIEKMLE